MNDFGSVSFVSDRTWPLIPITPWEPGKPLYKFYTYGHKEEQMPDKIHYWKDGQLQEADFPENADNLAVFSKLIEISEGRNTEFILLCRGYMLGPCRVYFEEDQIRIVKRSIENSEAQYIQKTNQDGAFWYFTNDNTGKMVSFWAGRAIYLGGVAFDPVQDYDRIEYSYIQIQDEGNPFDGKIIDIQTNRVNFKS